MSGAAGRGVEEHELLERQNDERTDQLLGKIRALRQVIIYEMLYIYVSF